MAKGRLEQLWEQPLAPSLSVQVLQEFFVNLVRKKVEPGLAREVVENYLAWQVIDNDRALFLQGFEEQERWQLSFWDALILAAARRSGARILWSEDFSTGQEYGGILVVNPLLG